MAELFFYLGQSLVTRGTHQLDRSRRLTRQTPPVEFEFPFIDVPRGNQYIGTEERKISKRSTFSLNYSRSNAFFNEVFFFFFDERSFIDNFIIDSNNRWFPSYIFICLKYKIICCYKRIYDIWYIYYREFISNLGSY